MLLAALPCKTSLKRKEKDKVMAGEESEVRKGPWTLEEDRLLLHYIACHGEGRWNLLARSSGLRRTGKSARLRWLNYLKPDVKRGNLSPQEQLLILELHSRWGNRWSKIAQHLPGRTDNEVKNYWRTRVQKQARQLKIDANSARFRDTVRLLWMPRLLHQMQSSSSFSNQLNLIAPPLLQQSSPINMNDNNIPITESHLYRNHTMASRNQIGPTQVLEMSEMTARSCTASSNNLAYDPFIVAAHHLAGATWDQPTPAFDQFTCTRNLGLATSGSAIHVEDGPGLECYLGESDWMSFDQDDQIMRLQV